MRMGYQVGRGESTDAVGGDAPRAGRSRAHTLGYSNGGVELPEGVQESGAWDSPDALGGTRGI